MFEIPAPSPIKGSCAKFALGAAYGLNIPCHYWIEYTMSLFIFELIIPFNSELIIISLAGI